MSQNKSSKKINNNRKPAVVVKKAKAKQSNNTKMRTSSPQKLVSLSECSVNYLRALANPFADGPLACIPSYPALLSSKQKVWAKGTLSTSATTGFGFITVNPFYAAANNSTTLYWSDSTYAGTSVVTSLPGGVSVGSTNSQYVGADFAGTAAGLQFRLVSAGLRVRYMGTELNRGGYKIGFQDPTHDNSNGLTLVDLNAELTAVRFPVQRNWSTVLYQPIIDAELSYLNNILTFQQFFMTFIVIAASSTTPLEYEWEFYANFEFQGRTLKNMTPSHFDPSGFAAANSVATNSPALRPSAESSEKREAHTVAAAAHAVANAMSSASIVSEELARAVSSGSKLAGNASNIIKDAGKVAQFAAPFLFSVL